VEAKSLYRGEGDFLFASTRLNGMKPLSPDSLLKKSTRPALKRAGITGKVIGWHNFRHSLATNLRAIGVDIKVAQEILRHANSRTTMDVYTHVVSAQKHEATGMIIDFIMHPTRTLRPQHPLAPSLVIEDAASC
jgi:site-specific recombinase XerD